MVLGRPEGADPNDPNVELVPILTLRFHRLDMRLFERTGNVDGTYRVVLGYDESITGAAAAFETLSLEPIFRRHYLTAERLHQV